MLSLLKLPPQQNRDAVMILHMGGVFGSKPDTLSRFRENYARLSDSVKRRLVLENDDVSWSVHDLLPVCQELNIPLVLDYHHHNILFDSEKIREGTKDIMSMYEAITETWTRKGITQKMHYSEPTPAAITPRQRRKHSPRVATLPPCANTMDLMIEAKDKEQAVFELMRTFKLPGFDTFNDMIPHTRPDDNKALIQAQNKVMAQKKRKMAKNNQAQEQEDAENIFEMEGAVNMDEVGMGGPEGRVYWPPGMEEWLRPVKRVVGKKNEEGAEGTDGLTKATPKKRKQANAPIETPKAVKEEEETTALDSVTSKTKKVKTPKKTPTPRKRKAVKSVPTPSTSDAEDMSIDEFSVPGERGEERTEMELDMVKMSARRSKRASRISYAEAELSA